MSTEVWNTHQWFTAEAVTATTVLDLDYQAGHIAPPFEPTEDDQQVRNDVTAKRPQGSSARVARVAGPLSTQPPPDGVGRYDESVDVNVETDVQLADQAGWRVHLGTVDEPRYPAVTIDLHRNLDLMIQVAAMESGDRMTVANVPEWLPPGDVDELLQGYRERISPFEWKWEANTSPASPWTVAVAGDTVLGRLDTGGSELAADVPVDEVLNSNTSFETDTVGWLTTNLGTGSFERSTAQAHDGVASGLLTPDGVASFPSVFQGANIDGPVTAGDDYTAAPWVYSPNGYGDVRVRIDWRDNTDTIFADSGAAGFTVPAATWTQIDVTAAAPAGAVAAGVRLILGGTPAASDTLHIDEAELRPTAATTFDVATTAVAPWIDSTGFPAEFPFDVQVGGEFLRVTGVTGTSSPQTFTVTRAINGVVKAHAAGSPLSLAQPAIVAL